MQPTAHNLGSLSVGLSVGLYPETSSLVLPSYLSQLFQYKLEALLYTSGQQPKCASAFASYAARFQDIAVAESACTFACSCSGSSGSIWGSGDAHAAYHYHRQRT